MSTLSKVYATARRSPVADNPPGGSERSSPDQALEVVQLADLVGNRVFQGGLTALKNQVRR